jgi:peptidoglycan/LPS O-acetylase OafA/YrhL
MSKDSTAHLEALDGLRGTAAFSVLAFHFFEFTTPDVAHNPLRHAHLAVDFFFALSGFVVGHAYDPRRSSKAPPNKRMGLGAFLLRRIIRLHPMVLVGMVFGLASYLWDPFVGPGPRPSPALIALTFGLSLLLLPSPALPNRFGDTHCLDSPAWTLFQEYIANLLYGLVGHRLPQLVLGALCLPAAAALLLTGLHFGNLSTGWAWTNVWAASVRLAYPFLAGLWLSRSGLRGRVPGSYVWLSLALFAVFTAPFFGKGDGLFEPLVVIFVFPLVLYLGAGEMKLSGPIGAVCRFTGRLSYPLYIIHYPALYIFAHWLWSTHPTPAQVWLVSTAIYAGAVAAAWLLLVAYDEPLRRFLNRRLARAPSAEQMSNVAAAE